MSTPTFPKQKQCKYCGAAQDTAKAWKLKCVSKRHIFADIKYFWEDKPLFNVIELNKDFNFFDIQANYFGEDGKEKLGKFYLKDLGTL